MGKALLGGIVGGIILFVWGAAAHMVFQLGDSSLKALPAEDSVLSALRSTVREDGMYFFPGMDMSVELSEAQQAEWEAKYKAGPAGLLIYQAAPGEVMPPRQLVTQFLADTAAAILGAFLLLHVAAAFGYGRRVLLATALGVIATLVVNVPYWNWYKFDPAFTVGAAVENTVGWFLCGLWLAWFCRERA